MSRYGVHQVSDRDGMAFLRDMFSDGVDELNWVVFSTSGVHGSYMTLDDIAKQRALKPGDADYEEGWTPRITFVAVSPRIVRMSYGNAVIETEEDALFIRKLCRDSLLAIAKSQAGNI